MSKHDEARRAFLVGAVAGAGAAAGAGLAPQALAQTAPRLKEAAPAAHAHSRAPAMARSSTTKMPRRLLPSPNG